jgi:hypothetical protein
VIISTISEYFYDYRGIFAEFIANTLAIVSITLYPEYRDFYEHIRALLLYALHIPTFIKSYVKPLFSSEISVYRIPSITRKSVEDVLTEAGLPNNDFMKAYAIVKLISHILPHEIKNGGFFKLFLSALTISVMKDTDTAKEVDKQAIALGYSPQEMVFATILLHMFYPPIVKDIISRGAIEEITEAEESEEGGEHEVMIEETMPAEDYTEGMSEEQKTMLELLYSKENDTMNVKPFSLREAGLSIKPYI